jgi:ankyrin repeat protein
MKASQNGHTGVVQLLVEANVDVNAHTKVGRFNIYTIGYYCLCMRFWQGGYTALMNAADRGHADIIQLLQGANATIDTQNEVVKS